MITQELAGHNQVAVINPNFCTRHSLDLVISKNIWLQGNFVVKNANGKIMFKIKSSTLSLNRERKILDATGKPIVTLRKKTFPFSLSLHSTIWEVFRGEGKNAKDLIFSARRDAIFQMKTKLVVFVAKNKSEDVCNYTVQGSWFERSCDFFVGDDVDSSTNIIAQMHKNYSVSSLFTGKDRFKVTVFPNVDCAFVVALILILDEIASQANTKRSSSRRKRKH